jgi:predicted RND superfamily exporter protein
VAGVGGATLTGMPIVGADMQRMVRRELLRLMGLAAIAVGLWLLLCFRRPGAVLLMVLPTVGAFLTVGVVAGLGAVRLNPITLVIVPLVAGLGVDDGVFLVRAAVRAPRGRLIGRLRVASIAITTTSLTTGLAFASLLLTSIPAIRAMGLAMAAGIAGAWAVALFLLVPVLVVVRLGR